ncbi:MAG: T9SS type A sorting domain-containing protein [Bacteroidota bacterium]
MKKIICSLWVLIITSNFSIGQSFYRIDDYCFGTTKAENLAKVLKIGNNYYLAGNSSCPKAEWDKSENNCDTIFSHNNSWTICVDSNFNKIWDKTYGGRLNTNILDAINYRNGIVLSGKTESDSSCSNLSNGKGSPTNRDYILYFLDTMGNKINEIRLGSFSIEEECRVIETSDKGLLVVGLSDGSATGDRTQNSWGGTDFWGVKLDSLGNIQWDKAWGGNGNEDYLQGILPLNNGSFMIYGQTGSGNSGTVSGNYYGLGDAWVIVIDSTGSRIWDKSYGGTAPESISKVIFLNNYFYMLGGTSSDPTNGGSITQQGYGSSDIWLMKTDINGNIIWEKRYGASSGDVGVDFIINNNGEIFVLGEISASGNGCFPSTNYGSTDFVIMSIDSMGALISYKILGTNHQDGPIGMLAVNDSTMLLYGSSLVGTSDVKLCAGHFALPPASNAFNTDYWIIKMGYSTTTTSLNQLQNNLSLTVRPNPAKDQIAISGLPPASYVLQTYNIDGRLVMSDMVTSDLFLPLTIETLQSGMYITNIKNEKISTTVRWVKE